MFLIFRLVLAQSEVGFYFERSSASLDYFACIVSFPLKDV